MKITKKFKGMLSLALTAMLTVGSVTANATTQNTTNGLPQVDQGRTGSITIHKYGVANIPNPGTPANGLQLSDDEAAALGKPLENVEFKISKVPNNTTSAEQVTDEDKTETKTIKTDNKGNATLGDLKVGVYYVEEVKTGSIIEAVEPFLVSIPMAHPTENEWIYDVHVYPKNVVDNGKPTIDKSVTTSGNKHNTANINQDVLWIIEPQIPKDIATAVTYKVVDKLDEKLSYTGFEGVSFTNSSGDTVTLTEGEHYLLTEPSKDEKGGKLTIEFTSQGKQLLATALVEGQEKLPTVQISFKTVINEDANLGEPIYNNANLVYTNTFNEEISADPTIPENPEHPDGPTVPVDPDKIIDVPNSGHEKPEVHTGGVLLEKVDAADSNITLKGAKFKIYATLEDAEKKQNAIKNPANNTEDWEVTTDENGRAIFAGLSYGVKGNNHKEGSTTYYIVETVAPTYTVTDKEGNQIEKEYNILKKPFEVTVNATSHEVSNKVVVANSKFKLPVTGGVGTVIFTLGGLAIMGAAAFLYMRTTRRA